MGMEMLLLFLFLSSRSGSFKDVAQTFTSVISSGEICRLEPFEGANVERSLVVEQIAGQRHVSVLCRPANEVECCQYTSS